MPRKPILLFVSASLLLVSLSCNAPMRRQAPPDEERRLVLGEPVEILTTTVTPEGGVIRLDPPGSPLQGWTITVPAGAYSDATEFRVTSRPITSHTYGEAFDPQTPLVKIDNGGAVSGAFLTLEVPLDLSEGSFPLAFTYDESSGELEGLPVMPEAGHVRIPMKTFSEITVAEVREALLNGTITTGFDPRRDMWPFPNNGSAAAPGGFCAGESLTSLYYYDSRSNQALRTAYDGYDNPHAPTPSFVNDDRMGIRLSSAAQKNIKFDPAQQDPSIDWWLQAQWDKPRVAYLTLAGIMLVTNRPQLVHLDNPSTAHAVVAYGAEDGRRILIADPNHPGEGRVLTFDPAADRFEPYLTGTTADSTPVAFDRVFFLRKRDVIDWGVMGGLWQAFLAGKVGDDLFPAYTIWASSADESSVAPPVPLTDGFQAPEEKLRLTFEPQDFQGRMVLYREDGEQFDSVESGGWTVIDLKDEQTTIGFLIEENRSDRRLWVDFRWLRIQRSECLASPDTVVASYEWNQPGEQSWSGSGGSGCRFEYTLRNVSDEPLVALVHTRFDNNAMQLEAWKRLPLAAGEQGSTTVDRTVYSDGVITFTVADRLLLVRDLPQCQAFLSDDNEDTWMSLSAPIADFGCE